MANGILIIDKPQDWTSMDVCARLRRCLGERRIGHAGTLDPMATGVLPVFVGRATRAVEFASEGQKEYLAGLRLGLVTDTQDTSGAVLEERPAAVTPGELEAVLPRFRGPIQQVPPYVRTLCHDIGQALGCGGTMFSLRRTMAAGFSLEQALPLERVLSHSEPHSLLLPVDTYFQDRPPLTLPPALEKKVRNGMAFPLPGTAEGEYRVYGEDGGFLALSQVRQGVLTTVKSFYEVT